MVVMDHWMKAAMADDTVVADFLLRLKNSKPASVSAKSHATVAPPPWLRWGMKRLRSSLTAASRCAAVADVTAVVVPRKKDEADSTRYSPTTPLSWSGGASPSSTADGNEESSRATVHSNRSARSKGTATGDHGDTSASTKKCKRKKSYAELMEEESSLLKERIHLTEEIANKNATFKAQIARNERLKRIKLDLGSTPLDKPSSSANEHVRTLHDQPQQRIVPSRALTNATEVDTHPQAADSKAIRTPLPDLNMIPDLNMMPSEDDSNM